MRKINGILNEHVRKMAGFSSSPRKNLAPSWPIPGSIIWLFIWLTAHLAAQLRGWEFTYTVFIARGRRLVLVGAIVLLQEAAENTGGSLFFRCDL